MPRPFLVMSMPPRMWYRTVLSDFGKSPASVWKTTYALGFFVYAETVLLMRDGKGRMKPLTEVETDTTPADAPNPGQVVERDDQHAQLLGLMQQLPDNQREVVRLKFQNGLSYKEIAAITELSVSNVGFLLHTALNKLRAQVAAVGE